jgi:hypothetical protein
LTRHLAADILAAPLGSMHYALRAGEGLKGEIADERNRFGRILGSGFLMRKLWRSKQGIGREARWKIGGCTGTGRAAPPLSGQARWGWAWPRASPLLA